LIDPAPGGVFGAGFFVALHPGGKRQGKAYIRQGVLIDNIFTTCNNKTYIFTKCKYIKIIAALRVLLKQGIR